MKNLLAQLENNEAILLMYLAGELPEADRAEVEQMLARDPALRLELEQLAALHGELTGLLAGADEARIPARGHIVASRLAPSIAQFAAARLKPAPQLKPSRSLRLARFLYPAAAAAAILIAWIIWTHQPRPGTQLADNKQIVIPNRIEPTPPEPEIFRTDRLADLEDEVVKIAAGEEDLLGFRNWDRQ